MTTPGVIPNPAFAVPSPGTEPPPGWSNTYNQAWASPAENDPQRLGTQPTRDYRPHPADPPENFWLGVRGPGRERIQRHGVEYQDADGMAVDAPSLKPQARNPRETTAPEPRPTNRMSPRTYTFTRPFDQHAARQLNGSHFSMADNRRTYPIMGMAPVRRSRNTFRAIPEPWDANLVDMPSDVGGSRPGPIVAVDVPSTRNFRLV